MSSRKTLIWSLIISICALVTLLPIWTGGNFQAEMLNQARLQFTLIYCVLFGIVLSTKHIRLIGSMAAVLIFNIYWMSSAYPTLDASQPGVASSQSLRLYSQNIYEANQKVPEVVRSIRRTEPDVVVLIEVSEPVFDYLVTELSAQFPYRDLQNKHYMKPGLAIFSKYKLEPRVDSLPEDPRLPSVKTRIQFHEKPIDVIGIHLESPHDKRRIISRNKQIGKLLTLITKQQESNVPLLLVGDMNTTPWNSRFREFQQQTGLKHTESFWNLNNSWPTWIPVALGFSIDHVLIDNRFCSAERFRIPTVGSDHFAFVSELKLCA